MAAVAALGDRGADPEIVDLVRRLATAGGELAGVARLAAFDLAATRPVDTREQRPGLTVAQLFLHADLDRELSRAGAGDNGGIATMLVRLGDALVDEAGNRPGADDVPGIGGRRRRCADPPGGRACAGPIPLMSEPTDAANAWPLSVAAERGIRRALTANGRVDVLHLRMADVGSWPPRRSPPGSASRPCSPWRPTRMPCIHALDMTGALTRANFGVRRRA